MLTKSNIASWINIVIHELVPEEAVISAAAAHGLAENKFLRECQNFILGNSTQGINAFSFSIGDLGGCVSSTHFYPYSQEEGVLGYFIPESAGDGVSDCYVMGVGDEQDFANISIKSVNYYSIPNEIFKQTKDL